MKVKLFSGTNYQIVERAINMWLESNRGIKVKFVTQSQEGGEAEMVGIIVINVWYEEEK